MLGKLHPSSLLKHAARSMQLRAQCNHEASRTSESVEDFGMRLSKLIRCISSSSGCHSTVCSPPAWWKAGHARKQPGSLAEAELLSHLAVLLRPEEPIEELFRDFPAVRSDGWSRKTLSPDLTVYGALQAQEAALFLEYDGYYRHLMPPGVAADARKSKALLDFAPAGSYVLRIAHSHREWEPSCEMGEVVVDTWQPSREASLVKALRQVALFLLRQRGNALQPRLEAKLQTFVENPSGISRQAAVEFTEKVVLERECEFDPAPLHEFLQAQLNLSYSEGEEFIRKCPALARCSIEDRLLPRMQFLEACGLNKVEVAKIIVRSPAVLGLSVEEKLKPKVQWLRDLGLTKAEVAKAIARHPQLLGLSLDENLKHTVHWLRYLGLTTAGVSKVVVRSPSVLGLSIEQNLKLTVQWLRDVGLTQAEVAKVIARFPSVLGLSIEENLKHMVHWLRDVVGLTQAEVAKVIARCPHLLGHRLEENLKPKVQWLRDLGLTKAVLAKVVARFPGVLGLSVEGNLKPTVHWLRDLGLTQTEVAKVIARSPQLLGHSLDENLKHTVDWLRDLGLTTAGVSKVVVRSPSVLGLSIEQNLKPTVQWLRDVGLTKAEVAKVIARHPQMLGYSIEENLKPTVQWLRDLGLTTAEVAKVTARHPQLLGLSLEENLKHKVLWLRGLGLTKADVVKILSGFPQILWLNIERSLKPKVSWLLEQFSAEWVHCLLVRNPYILSRRHQRWVRRSQILRECGKLSVFGSAVLLTDAKFAARYEGKTRGATCSFKRSSCPFKKPHREPIILVTRESAGLPFCGT